MLRPVLIALQFLTALPVRIEPPPSAEEVGRSTAQYPLVGLLIGVLLALIAWALGESSPLIAAAVLLIVWVLVTGALHLDGLADSADAWLGGLGDGDKTLAIMKDPSSGPAAVVALVLVLLSKFTALSQLIPAGSWALLLIVPLLARTTLVLLFLTTDYVRSQGLGSALSHHLPPTASKVAILLSVVGALLSAGKLALWMILGAALLFLLLRRLMLRRIGGTTGDTAGALVELAETTMLLIAAFLVPSA